LVTWNCTGGNLTSPTLCQPICKDGYLVGNETCDDGLPYQTDWRCNSNCIGNFNGWDCISDVQTFPNTICTEICGDGIVVGTETCDDGILNDGEGCKTNCKEAYLGWNCTGGDSVSSTICVEICDDGYKVGTELCDDLIVHPDWVGCYNNCTGNWDGWNCTNTDNYQPTSCIEICGDGI